VRLGADALIERGNRALERGDAEQALEYFGRASELTRSPEPHLGVARSYERMGRLDLAILRYERAIELSPRFAPAWVGLAAARERTGSMNALETWLQVYSMSSDARTRARAEDAIRRLGGTPP
jgi:tetratricopeptide (TPR) repeat protein